MSGGYFNYMEGYLLSIIDELESIEEDDIKEVSIDEEIAHIYALLKEGHIRLKRLDYYLSGDDGPESYRDRLQDDLKKLF